MKQKVYGLNEGQWTTLLKYLDTRPHGEIKVLLHSLSSVQIWEVTPPEATEAPSPVTTDETQLNGTTEGN